VGRHRRRSWRVVEAAVLVVGLVALTCGVLWQLQVLPGNQLELPPPAAFQGVAGVRDVHVAAPGLPLGVTTRDGSALPLAGAPGVRPSVAPRLDTAALPGVAKRLVINSIGLETPVVAGGVKTNADGSTEWETVPFIAVHYAALTALIGAPGNAVIAGHVSTRAEGNVFIDLYRVQLGDEVRVWDERDALHVFTISGIRLVPPTDTSVMDETADPTLTLMTCGGTFDPIRREFSDRLVVTATPA
jgi:LPXTG-site transpeptidase (sortase) family protein